MTNDRQIVDLIERASNARPWCECGWHTTPIWRDGAVWLECASLAEPPRTRFARLLAALNAPRHVHVRLVDVPPAPPESAALAPSG